MFLQIWSVDKHNLAPLQSNLMSAPAWDSLLQWLRSKAFCQNTRKQNELEARIDYDSQSPPPVKSFLSRSPHPKSSITSQTVSLPGDWILKYMSLWGMSLIRTTCSFKGHQLLSLLPSSSTHHHLWSTLLHSWASIPSFSHSQPQPESSDDITF